MAMAYDVPPSPRDYVPALKPRIRTDADRRRLGMGTIAFGAVFFIGSFAYSLHSSSMTKTQAFLTTFPLFLLFAAIGGAIWTQGAEGIRPMIAYLSAVVSLCALVAYWLWGK